MTWRATCRVSRWSEVDSSLVVEAFHERFERASEFCQLRPSGVAPDSIA